MSRLFFAMLLALGSTSASADWDDGDNYFYVVDPTVPIEISFVSSFATDNLALSVASRDDTGALGDWQIVFVKTGNSEGASCTGCGYDINTLSFSYMPTGSEIVFRFDNTTTGNTYYSGAKTGNADNYAHTKAIYDYYNGKTLVGFEDHWLGGDK
ncbi:MAG: hypothetical protein LBT71_00665, partial [Azoarcus sp.]|nr:hypothetical protein [Azoarcus sp.]